VIKPDTTGEPSEENAFIFKSTFNGGETCFFPLMAGKRANGCYSNCFAVGQSDLRFNLTDNKLEGNLGMLGVSLIAKAKEFQIY
jgi:hypothetical protein